MATFGLACCVSGEDGVAPPNAELEPVKFEEYAVRTGVAFEYAFFLAAYDFAEASSSLSESEIKAKAKAIYDEFLAPGAPKEIMVSALILRDLESKLADPKPEVFSRAMVEVGFILEPQCIGYARQYNMDLDSVKQSTKINLRPTFSSGTS